MYLYTGMSWHERTQWLTRRCSWMQMSKKFNKKIHLKLKLFTSPYTK